MPGKRSRQHALAVGGLAVLLACTFDSNVPGATDGENGSTSNAEVTTAPSPTATTLETATSTTVTTTGMTTELPPSTNDAETSVAGTTSDEPLGSSESTAAGCIPSDEACDEVDNDCDGIVDEGSPANDECGDCRFFLSNDEQSYFAVCAGPLTWADAREACELFGEAADLAIIDNDEDQAVLMGAVLEDAWIGLSDEGEEGHWVWVDGSDAVVDGINSGYGAWAEGEPEESDIQDCGELDPGMGGWSDSDCPQEQIYVCQHEAG